MAYTTAGKRQLIIGMVAGSALFLVAVFQVALGSFTNSAAAILAGGVALFAAGIFVWVRQRDSN